jgi:hypothetical protein
MQLQTLVSRHGRSGNDDDDGDDSPKWLLRVWRELLSGRLFPTLDEAARALPAKRTTAENPWTTHAWTTVRSDLDIAHVMLPLTDFRLQEAGDKSKAPAYRLVYEDRVPGPDYFKNTLLRATGTHAPTFSKVTQLEYLPAYSRDHGVLYAEISDRMDAIMAQNADVQRIEGTIQIPCHAQGQHSGEYTLPHGPMMVETIIQFYQFPNVVEGGRPLLVVRAPLSPLCPTNGHGMALGIGK